MASAEQSSALHASPLDEYYSFKVNVEKDYRNMAIGAGVGAGVAVGALIVTRIAASDAEGNTNTALNVLSIVQGIGAVILAFVAYNSYTKYRKANDTRKANAIHSRYASDASSPSMG